MRIGQGTRAESTFFPHGYREEAEMIMSVNRGLRGRNIRTTPETKDFRQLPSRKARGEQPVETTLSLGQQLDQLSG